MPSSVAERMNELFAGSESGHGTHGLPQQDDNSVKWHIKKTARTYKGSATIKMWEEHIEGKKPLGVIPIRGDGSCLWASIDRDDYEINYIETVAQVERLKLPFVPCMSKSGGVHLFIFFKEWVAAARVRRYLADVAATMGWAGSEIFPKQTEILTDRGDAGNWMVMPYYGDDYDGKIKFQHGIKKTGGEQTIEEFLNLAEKSKVDSSVLDARPRRAHTKATAVGSTGVPSKDEGVFEDGPPCLQHLAAQGVGPGTQNNVLLMMGIYYKKKYPDSWKEELEKANHSILNPPGSADGLLQAIRSLDRKDYNYTCKTEPMASHCNSGLCRQRRHGVGQAGSFPIISGLSKLDTDPPIWFVDVEEARLEVSTEVLQNYPKFHAACMERVNKCFMALKQSDWLQALGEAMVDVNLLEAPPEVGKFGTFVELLEEFLTNRQKGESREDILRGRPWEDLENGRHWFQLRDLEKFLVREGFKLMTRGQMTSAVKKLGGDSKFLNIKTTGRSCWWVPNNQFVRGDESSDPPPIKGVPI